MPTHKFKLGELVHPKQTPAINAPRGPYEIARLLLEVDGAPHYRIKSGYEEHERVAKETELTRYG